MYFHLEKEDLNSEVKRVVVFLWIYKRFFVLSQVCDPILTQRLKSGQLSLLVLPCFENRNLIKTHTQTTETVYPVQ